MLVESVRMHAVIRLLSAAALCLAIAIAGCGGGGSSTETSAPSRAQIYAESIANAPGPKVHIPNGAPPKKLVIRDLKIGHGKAAANGDLVTTEYVGISWEHKKYANSWTYPEPPAFVLGTGRLPRGFEKGILGMKAGGRRELIVPPNQLNRPGYDVGTLNPNATLVCLQCLRP